MSPSRRWTGTEKDTPPIVKVPTADQDARLTQMTEQIKTFAARIKDEAGS